MSLLLLFNQAPAVKAARGGWFSAAPLEAALLIGIGFFTGSAQPVKASTPPVACSFTVAEQAYQNPAPLVIASRVKGSVPCAAQTFTVGEQSYQNPQPVIVRSTVAAPVSVRTAFIVSEQAYTNPAPLVRSTIAVPVSAKTAFIVPEQVYTNPAPLVRSTVAAPVAAPVFAKTAFIVPEQAYTNPAPLVQVAVVKGSTPTLGAVVLVSEQSYTNPQPWFTPASILGKWKIPPPIWVAEQQYQNPAPWFNPTVTKAIPLVPGVFFSQPEQAYTNPAPRISRGVVNGSPSVRAASYIVGEQSYSNPAPAVWSVAAPLVARIPTWILATPQLDFTIQPIFFRPTPTLGVVRPMILASQADPTQIQPAFFSPAVPPVILTGRLSPWFFTPEQASGYQPPALFNGPPNRQIGVLGAQFFLPQQANAYITWPAQFYPRSTNLINPPAPANPGTVRKGGRVILNPKRQGETITVTFDFISQLGPTETISTAATTCNVWSGVDASPSAVISGSSTISGTKVNQNITGGVVGVIYYLTCQVTTSLGQTIQLNAYQAIITQVP